MLRENIIRPSVTLITLPYLISCGKEFYNSDHFSLNISILLISSLLLTDLIINKIIKKYVSNYIVYLLIICYIIILYGLYLSPLVLKLNDVGLNIRGRNLIVISLFTLSILPKIFPKILNGNFYIFNSFILIFSCTLILGKVKNYSSINENNFKNTYHPILRNKSSKPILLLITDEYSSPSELYKITKDSSLFNFTNKLKLDGWKTINASYSQEISTIHSLSSIFNYNLSNNLNYSVESIDNIGSKYLQKCELYNQSILNDIQIINFGIFQIGQSIQFSRLYYYPENFIELLLMYTIIPQIVQNTGGLELQGVNQNYYPMVHHNKYILDNMNDSLIKIQKNHIVYAHLYMPHGPHIYFDEFKFRSESIDSYISFWKFTNNKLYSLINKLKKSYKIILTGDHGYRHDRRINPHVTYTAYYGFNDNEVKRIHFVQDVGNLLIPVK